MASVLAVCTTLMPDAANAQDARAKTGSSGNWCKIVRSEDGQLKVEGEIEVSDSAWSRSHVKSIMALEEEGNRAFHYIHIARDSGPLIVALPAVSHVAFSVPAFEEASETVAVPVLEMSKDTKRKPPIPCLPADGI